MNVWIRNDVWSRRLMHKVSCKMKAKISELTGLNMLVYGSIGGVSMKE